MSRAFCESNSSKFFSNQHGNFKRILFIKSIEPIRNKKPATIEVTGYIGVHERNRTSGLRFRRASLYPTELRGHFSLRIRIKLSKNLALFSHAIFWPFFQKQNNYKIYIYTPRPHLQLLILTQLYAKFL